MKNAIFTQRLLSLLLVLGMLFVFAGCSKSGEVPIADNTELSSDAETEPSGTIDEAEAFAKPENYATVLLITINPQIRLYLDADGIVLAVEAVNKDAEEIKENLSLENDSYEVAVEKIVTKSEEKGYIKSNAVISIEITETKDPTVDATIILDKATITVNQTASKLELKIEIKTEDKTAADDQPDVNKTAPTEEPITAPTTPAQCNHTYRNATCTAPKTCSKCGAAEGNALGHSWSDATCTAPKTCKTCNTTEGNAAGHNWSDATCTAPKSCSKCGATEGEPIAHNYQAGLCSACGYRQLGVGKWSTIILSRKSRVVLNLDDADAYREALYDIESPYWKDVHGMETVDPEWFEQLTDPKITYQGIDYVVRRIGGCRCDYELVGETLTVYDPDGCEMTLERVSATEMMVIEISGMCGTYGIETGCIFAYQPE